MYAKYLLRILGIVIFVYFIFRGIENYGLVNNSLVGSGTVISVVDTGNISTPLLFPQIEYISENGQVYSFQGPSCDSSEHITGCPKAGDTVLIVYQAEDASFDKNNVAAIHSPERNLNINYSMNLYFRHFAFAVMGFALAAITFISPKK